MGLGTLNSVLGVDERKSWECMESADPIHHDWGAGEWKNAKSLALLMKRNRLIESSEFNKAEFTLDARRWRWSIGDRGSSG
jgi:hypothetical protein